MKDLRFKLAFGFLPKTRPEILDTDSVLLTLFQFQVLRSISFEGILDANARIVRSIPTVSGAFCTDDLQWFAELMLDLEASLVSSRRSEQSATLRYVERGGRLCQEDLGWSSGFSSGVR